MDLSSGSPQGRLLSLKNSNHAASSKVFLIAIAWIMILVASDLPRVILQASIREIPAWLRWGQMISLLIALLLCLLLQKLRPLLAYAGILLVFFAAVMASGQIQGSDWWQGYLAGQPDSFTFRQLMPFIPDTGIAVAILIALWAIQRSREHYFLVKGDMQAPIEPVPWLGIGKGESWKVFGWIFTVAAALAVAIPTFIGMSLPAGIWSRLVPLLPIIFALAAINAFNEEIYFRATLLSTLPQVIGKKQPLLINAALFGMAHYYGSSPPGVLGVLMTGFLGWLLGKAMLETRGLAWPWFMHFVPDVVVFASYAVAWLGQ
jgi:membrane protease YdiL (CAAX protease family)